MCHSKPLCAQTQLQLRTEAWKRLTQDLAVEKIEAVTQVLGLDQAIPIAHEILSGKVHDRIVIDVNR